MHPRTCISAHAECHVAPSFAMRSPLSHSCLMHACHSFARPHNVVQWGPSIFMPSGPATRTSLTATASCPNSIPHTGSLYAVLLSWPPWPRTKFAVPARHNSGTKRDKRAGQLLLGMGQCCPPRACGPKRKAAGRLAATCFRCVNVRGLRRFDSLRRCWPAVSGPCLENLLMNRMLRARARASADQNFEKFGHPSAILQ